MLIGQGSQGTVFLKELKNQNMKILIKLEININIY
jgi:hypothetical protein